MKIKYITEDNLNFLKHNLGVVFKKVVQDKESSIIDFSGDPSFIQETSIEITDFQLDLSQPKGKESLTDLENIQRVYNHMRFLSDSQASDERIWAAYSFYECIDYMRYRWPARRVKDIENRYLFGYSIQRSLFRNGISRLWWIGRVTYDNTRSDPYELTRFLCKNQDFIESICGRNVFNNPVVGKTTISALLDAEREGIQITREVVRDIGEYVNLLGGIYLIDSLDPEAIYLKIRNRLGRSL